MKILPEYNLSEFPPKYFYTRKTALSKIKEKYKNNFIISGYTEVDGFDFYSSALVIDGEDNYNIKKKYLWGKLEKKIFTGSTSVPSSHNLSIGRTLVLICNDAFEKNYGPMNMPHKKIWGELVL